MDIFKIENNRIFVIDKTQFNPKHILECGQIFRFGTDPSGNYYVYSKNHKATIIDHPNSYEIICDDNDYFINFFDLKTDYNKIKQQLKKVPLLSPMIDFGYGIRILNSDPEEMIYSYIISQNNNIKRIQKIIEKFCLIGETIGNFHAFPTTKEISIQSESFFKSLGAGYRDKFLKETSNQLKSIDINSLKSLKTDELYNFLLSLNGVGPKVASCILLFGFGRKEKFPVDTWIEQVYYNHFEKTKLSRPAIQQYFENIFGDYSGLAQQYLFYFERENNK